MVLDAAIADEVRRLSGGGKSRRQISKQLEGRVSRASVSAIVNGTWKGTAPRERESEVVACPPTRCDGCGGTVIQAPCRACAVREPKSLAATIAKRSQRLRQLLAGRVTRENEHLAGRVTAAARSVWPD